MTQDPRDGTDLTPISRAADGARKRGGSAGAVGSGRAGASVPVFTKNYQTAALRRWQDPAYRAAMQARWEDPVFKEKMRLAGIRRGEAARRRKAAREDARAQLIRAGIYPGRSVIRIFIDLVAGGVEADEAFRRIRRQLREEKR